MPAGSETGDALYFADGTGWRAWLEENHLSSKGVFVRIFKVASPKPGLRLEEAIEEALCFGWIDSVMKSIDPDHFILRFSPRRKGSSWATSNLVRMRKLDAEGRMTSYGMARLEVPVEDLPERAPRPSKDVPVPDLVERGLK